MKILSGHFTNLTERWRWFALPLLVSLLCSNHFAVQGAATTGPNIVVILADDQGWGDLSINGNTNLSTPRIDSLARSGAMFDRFYVSPLCSPTRAEFLTGRYNHRLGVHGVTTGAERLSLDEKTIADAFQAAGYRTGAFGKWHNGAQYPYHPNGRGFEEFYGFCSGHWGTYFDPPLEHNGKPVQGKGYIADDFTDHAIDFIRSSKDRPFFCYVAFNTPHSPMQVPDRFYNQFKDRPLGMRARNPAQENVAHTRAALAMCENMDWNVGRILDTLAALHIDDQTIVLYFSDNGPNGWRWNGGMKGRKGSLDEGGIRAPLFVSWPGHIPKGSAIPHVSAAVDLLPTLTDLARIPLAPAKPLDGVSLKPLLMDPKAPWPDRLIFSHWNGKLSVRSRQYRLDPAGQLFDMEADPGQQTNIAQHRPGMHKSLLDSASNFMADLPSPAKQDQRPFTVGCREFPMTQLPARDGVPHGGIRRSANAPNCSFFENWTTTGDFITWDIEVATAGAYTVEILHTCPPNAIGTEIELRFQDATVCKRVAKHHDPPLRGADHDRVPRQGESYVKDFKPLALGTMTLPKGRGLLTLRATHIPAAKAIDVRSVVLTLQPLPSTSRAPSEKHQN